MGLEVVEEGSGERLVVLVHGVVDRAASFSALAEFLRHDCRVLRYDRRGYGAAASAGPVGAAEHIADLQEVMGGRRALLVGHSFGGVVALGAAAEAPELVEGVVLYESGFAWLPGWDDTVMTGVFRAEDPEEAALRLMLGPRYDELSSEQQARRRPAARAFLVEEWSVRQAPPFDPAAVTAPVVYGRSDPAVLGSTVEQLRARLPDFEVVTLPGADHHAHRNDPVVFAQLVRRGLERGRTAAEMGRA